eukprot:GHVS01054399.1.p1 GENE.GHVS01054399.1~~GHVS01054399.1.p1  ORF type:complete len:452 (+),score=77.16 GHVS01054399.1:67-1356(+)
MLAADGTDGFSSGDEEHFTVDEIPPDNKGQASRRQPRLEAAGCSNRSSMAPAAGSGRGGMGQTTRRCGRSLLRRIANGSSRITIWHLLCGIWAIVGLVVVSLFVHYFYLLHKHKLALHMEGGKYSSRGWIVEEEDADAWYRRPTPVRKPNRTMEEDFMDNAFSSNAGVLGANASMVVASPLLTSDPNIGGGAGGIRGVGVPQHPMLEGMRQFQQTTANRLHRQMPVSRALVENNKTTRHHPSSSSSSRSPSRGGRGIFSLTETAVANLCECFKRPAKDEQEIFDFVTSTQRFGASWNMEGSVAAMMNAVEDLLQDRQTKLFTNDMLPDNFYTSTVLHPKGSFAAQVVSHPSHHRHRLQTAMIKAREFNVRSVKRAGDSAYLLESLFWHHRQRSTCLLVTDASKANLFALPIFSEEWNYFLTHCFESWPS